jgi:hypothetical protein
MSMRPLPPIEPHAVYGPHHSRPGDNVRKGEPESFVLVARRISNPLRTLLLALGERAHSSPRLLCQGHKQRCVRCVLACMIHRMIVA